MQKRSILAGVLALAAFLAASPVRASGPASYDDAISQAKERNLRVLIDFGAEF